MNTASKTVEELQKLNQELKQTFNLVSYCKVNNYIDVLDNSNNWCVGKILNMESNHIFISFDGWKDSFNEVNF